MVLNWMTFGNDVTLGDEISLGDIAFCRVTNSATRNNVPFNVSDGVFNSIKSYCQYLITTIMTWLLPKNRELLKSQIKINPPILRTRSVRNESPSSGFEIFFRTLCEKGFIVMVSDSSFSVYFPRIFFSVFTGSHIVFMPMFPLIFPSRGGSSFSVIRMAMVVIMRICLLFFRVFLVIFFSIFDELVMVPLRALLHFAKTLFSVFQIIFCRSFSGLFRTTINFHNDVYCGPYYSIKSVEWRP